MNEKCFSLSNRKNTDKCYYPFCDDQLTKQKECKAFVLRDDADGFVSCPLSTSVNDSKKKNEAKISIERGTTEHLKNVIINRMQIFAWIIRNFIRIFFFLLVRRHEMTNKCKKLRAKIWKSVSLLTIANNIKTNSRRQQTTDERTNLICSYSVASFWIHTSNAAFLRRFHFLFYCHCTLSPIFVAFFCFYPQLFFFRLSLCATLPLFITSSAHIIRLSDHNNSIAEKPKQRHITRCARQNRSLARVDFSLCSYSTSRDFPFTILFVVLFTSFISSSLY